jgi:hypothetical protein
MLNIITCKNKWQEILLSSDSYDFYHTYDYHYASKEDNETSTLIVYRKENILIAIPILIRRVFNTNNFDATSVYGYVGPIQKNITYPYNNTDFLSELNQFFNEKRITSIFSRLNPLIDNQNELLTGLGQINSLGRIVNIDITKNLDIQKSSFSKDFKSFKVWKHIINEEIYNKLVQDKNIDSEIDFFPKYRYTTN